MFMCICICILLCLCICIWKEQEKALDSAWQDAEERLSEEIREVMRLLPPARRPSAAQVAPDLGVDSGLSDSDRQLADQFKGQKGMEHASHPNHAPAPAVDSGRSETSSPSAASSNCDAATQMTDRTTRCHVLTNNVSVSQVMPSEPFSRSMVSRRDQSSCRDCLAINTDQ